MLSSAVGKGTAPHDHGCRLALVLIVQDAVMSWMARTPARVFNLDSAPSSHCQGSLRVLVGQISSLKKCQIFGSFFYVDSWFVHYFGSNENQTGAVVEAKLKGRMRWVCPVAPSLPCWVAFGGQVEIMGDDEAGTHGETPRQPGFYQRSQRPACLWPEA